MSVFVMALEGLSVGVAELFNRAFRLVAMIRLGKASARDIDELLEVLVNLHYEVIERGRRVDALMN